jgi:ADP-heptose:LPS heptosyltransferase
MKILIIRMMGLGDVASILVPAVTLYRKKYPNAHICVLTYEAGGEIMELHPGVDQVMSITKGQWPEDLLPATREFMRIGQLISAEQFDLIANLDTWFMPCFLARALRDVGFTVEGNYINRPVEDVLRKAADGVLSQSFFEKPAQYMESSFQNMYQWTVPWWQKFPGMGYPAFYLQKCCGFDGSIDISLPCTPDPELVAEAEGRPIIALSMRGRALYKNYGYAESLVNQLTIHGVHCWSQFDGSVPIRATLNKLCASSLLITVPTSSQWLARLAGCPSLVLPGPMSPSLLDAEFYPPEQTDCQYCYQESECPESRNYECMEISPAAIAKQALSILKSTL